MAAGTWMYNVLAALWACNRARSGQRSGMPTNPPGGFRLGCREHARVLWSAFKARIM